MKVIHLSTHDKRGGAAKACNRLHKGLQRIDVDSSLFVRFKHSNVDSVLQFHPSNSLIESLCRILRYMKVRSDFYPWYTSWPGDTGTLMSDDRTRFASEVSGQMPSADIFHLHWVTGFVDIPAFFRYTDIPIVWTLHDMNPITGGCHYNFGCRRFEESCGCCPRIGSSTEIDPSRKSWNRKQAVYEEQIDQNKLHLVSPSEWLARQANRSTLLENAPVYRIPNGLDATLFRPRYDQDKRLELNIPESHRIVLFVAHSSTDPRKGIDLLVDALDNTYLQNVTFVSVGADGLVVPDKISHVHVGHVESEKRLSTLYSLADIFVIPSLQDNLPNTVLESMACGTPVVAFDVGGISDMVRPGETGWLAEMGSVRELRRAIETALESDVDREQMARRCRQVVENEYTMEHQARQYTELYTSILENFRND